jgi:hypothetical protein
MIRYTVIRVSKVKSCAFYELSTRDLSCTVEKELRGWVMGLRRAARDASSRFSALHFEILACRSAPKVGFFWARSQGDVVGKGVFQLRPDQRSSNCLRALYGTLAWAHTVAIRSRHTAKLLTGPYPHTHIFSRPLPTKNEAHQ